MPANPRYNWLVVAIIALVLINIGTLAFLWLGRPGAKHPDDHRPGDAKAYLVKELQLNQQQQQQFDSLRKIHFTEMENDREQMRELKDALFEKLRQPNDSGYTNIAQEIGNLQSRIDLATFHHFQSLRTICNLDQQARFDNIIQEVLRNMGRPMPGPEGPGGRPPEDGPPPR